MRRHGGSRWKASGGMALLVACACMAAAQGPGGAGQLPDSCRSYLSIPVPKSELPPPAAGAACDSETLYYGFDRPPQPALARECAYRELGRRDPGNPISGEAILSMVYANGRGAPRNLDLALRFACQMDGAPAEMEGRIAHLEKLKANGWAGSNFDVCDDITSGYMGGFCAEKQERFHRAARSARLSTLTARWRPAERQALAALQGAAQRFFDAHAGNEIDHSGSARAEQEIDENARCEDAFVADIERFERGDLPDQTADFAAADASLNSLYPRLLRAAGPRMGSVTADGIRQTERLWIPYRDAWAKFGRTRYPATTAESWQTWATRQRIGQLQGLLGER